MAALDLGSNSFHMVVARAHHDQLAIVDRLREMVRLASGLDEHACLDDASRERALQCLRRFGQRLRDMHAHQVRVVGTNTLRKAHNAQEFVEAVEEALGHPVEIISGIEEARLIYLGASHDVPRTDGPMLVVDIGGGSTELIIGEGYEPKHLESLFVGCVSLSQRFFGDGELSRERFNRARLQARLELSPVVAAFRSLGWERAVGSSGTIRAAERVLHALGLVESGVTLAALETLISAMVEAGRIDNLTLSELNEERAPVFPGGLAILVELLRVLDIDHLEICEGALREGVLYDMLGRLQHEDARERSIIAMQRRYHVDEAQAARVEATATALMAQVADAWQLSDERYEQMLTWAACLHEVGLDIGHAKYHQHGGYLLANADLPGFVRLEQQVLSTLVAWHRRKLDQVDLSVLPDGWKGPVFKLIVLLRLAVLLNRSRSPVELPDIRLQAGKRQLETNFPVGWLDDHQLTQADLELERDWLDASGFELRLGTFGHQEASAS